jgi:hypothetical protein
MSKYYEIVIYTASLSLYAEPLLDELDPYGHASYRLFREHCTFLNNIFVKDLTQLGRDLKDVIIVDNSPACYSLQPENAIPIPTWIDDQGDTELTQLIPLLKLLSRVGDVRPYIVRLMSESEVDYLATTEALKAELNSSRTPKSRVKVNKRVPPFDKTIAVNDKATLGPSHLRSTTNFIGTQRAGTSIMSGKHAEPARPVARTPIAKTSPKDMKKISQPRQVGNRSDCSTPKSKAAPLTQKVVENGRPSTARYKEAPLHMNLMQKKGDIGRLHTGKPVIIASNIGLSTTKKHNKHSNSMQDPIQITNKVRLKKNLVEKKEIGVDSEKNVKSKCVMKQGETARCSTTKVKDDGKRTPTMKFNPLEIVKFHTGAKVIASKGKVKSVIKSKDGLLINAIQMAETGAKKPIILAYKK